MHFGAFSVKKLCPECSLETSNGNTYYMKQGFPNTSCFGYCLLQQPSLLTGTAAGAAGVSCGQGSWHQWYQPYASAHLTSSSSASCQPSPNTRMSTVSFLFFPQSHSLSPPPLFLPLHFQQLTSIGSVLARGGFGGRGCGTQLVYRYQPPKPPS